MLPVIIQTCMVLLGLLVLGASPQQATRAARQPLTREPLLAVTTFNVNYALAGDAATLAAITEAPADLIFLQETNRAWQRQVQPLLAARYPHQSWHDRPRAGGQAVLARWPLQAKQVLPSPTGWFPAVRVVVQTPLGQVQVLAVHLHPQVTEQGSWLLGHLATDALRLQEIAGYVDSLEGQLPTLIVGDFNEGTDGAALRFLEARGFRSALPEFAPEATTWHWPLGKLELHGQLDHLLYDAWFEPLSAAVIKSGRSDHFPVCGQFARATAGSERPRAPRGASMTLTLAAPR